MLGPTSRIALCLAWSLGACSFIFDAGPSASDAGPSTSDAGVDANLATCAEATPVIEPQQVDDLPCGETQINFPIVAVSSAAGPCPVDRLRWTMSKRPPDGGGGVELFSYEGAPSEPLPLEARVLGGTFQEPVFNVAEYHGPNLLRVNITTNGDGVNQVYQAVDGIADEVYIFRGTVMSGLKRMILVGLIEHTTPNGLPTFGLSGECLGTLDPSCAADSKMTTFIREFTTNGSTSTPRLRFTLGSAGEFYFDNVSLVRKSTGSSLVKDSSFDGPLPPLATDKWHVSCPGCNFSSAIVPIPEIIAEYATYTLELIAKGANGLESQPSQFVYNHAKCL